MRVAILETVKTNGGFEQEFDRLIINELKMENHEPVLLLPENSTLPVDFGIAEQFFSTDEQKRLFSRGDKEKLPFFYELWTVKESFIKTVGKGLSIPLNSFSVNFEERKIDFLEYSKENYYFKQYNIDDNYKMAVSGMYCSFSDDIIMFGQ